VQAVKAESRNLAFQLVALGVETVVTAFPAGREIMVVEARHTTQVELLVLLAPMRLLDTAVKVDTATARAAVVPFDLLITVARGLLVVALAGGSQAPKLAKANSAT
jgi:hypothetical protein